MPVLTPKVWLSIITNIVISATVFALGYPIVAFASIALSQCIIMLWVNNTVKIKYAAEQQLAIDNVKTNEGCEFDLLRAEFVPTLIESESNLAAIKFIREQLQHLTPQNIEAIREKIRDFLEIARSRKRDINNPVSANSMAAWKIDLL